MPRTGQNGRPFCECCRISYHQALKLKLGQKLLETIYCRVRDGMYDDVVSTPTSTNSGIYTICHILILSSGHLFNKLKSTPFEFQFFLAKIF